MKALNIPNTITIIRFLLIIPLIYFLFADNRTYAISLFLIFLALDSLDGKIARKLKQRTAFGTNFDFAIDILSGALIYAVLIFTNRIPILIIALAFINFLIYRKV